MLAEKYGEELEKDNQVIVDTAWDNMIATGNKDFKAITKKSLAALIHVVAKNALERAAEIIVEYKNEE